MAIHPVLTYPHPLLKTVSTPLEGINEGVLEVAASLVETLRSHDRCVGLAAPQIGIPVRLIAVDVTGHPKTTACHGQMVIVNPEVVATEGWEVGREGCLSLPSITADIRRAVRIFLKGYTLTGDEVRAETSGFEARAIQHEVDHLDGILILDRVASPAEIFPRRSPKPKP